MDYEKMVENTIYLKETYPDYFKSFLDFACRTGLFKNKEVLRECEKYGKLAINLPVPGTRNRYYDCQFTLQFVYKTILIELMDLIKFNPDELLSNRSNLKYALNSPFAGSGKDREFFDEVFHVLYQLANIKKDLGL